MTAMTLGGLSFPNDGSADVNGARWVITEYQGWDFPAIALKAITFVGRAGGVAAPSYVQPRPVTLTGVISMPTAVYYSTIETFTEELLGATNSDIRFTVSETIPKYVDMRLAAAPQIKRRAGSIEFNLSFMAFDPYKYTVAESSLVLSAGANTATNGGNAPAKVRIVTGATGAVDLQNGTVEGDPRVKTSSIASGSVIDTGRGTVISSGGANLYNSVNGVTEWWRLVPGANSLTYSGPTATLYWHNAWI